MQFNFDNRIGGKYTIGTVSFDFLDKNNVFDSFQENNDIHSDIIFETSVGKVKLLSQKILETIKDSGIRQDIFEKIQGLAKFIEESEGIQLTMD